MVCSKTVLDSNWRWLYSSINASFSPNRKVVSWQRSLVYEKVSLLTLVGCFSGLISCSNCQNSVSGRDLESELYPSSIGIIPTQTQAASLALTDILHALTCEWLPGETVCGSCEQHCIYWGIQYWQLGKWCPYLGAAFRYLQPRGVTLENYLLRLCICVIPVGKCYSSTKLEFGLKCISICRPVPLWG